MIVLETARMNHAEHVAYCQQKVEKLIDEVMANDVTKYWACAECDKLANIPIINGNIH